MAASDPVAAVALDVEEIQDHTQPRFEIEAPVRWRWRELEARERDGVIRAALRALAGGGPEARDVPSARRRGTPQRGEVRGDQVVAFADGPPCSTASPPATARPRAGEPGRWPTSTCSRPSRARARSSASA